MYILHIADKNYSSWSVRPWVLMKALDIAFEERLHVFRAGSNFKEFRSFSPTGRVPVLEDGKTTVWDSLAIAEYLAERHSGVWPDDPAARAWARSAAAEMHSGFAVLRSRCPMNIGLRVRLYDTPPALVADIARIAEIWAEGQSKFGGPYLAGSTFTAVDAFYAPVVFRAQTYGVLTDKASSAYIAHMLRQPALRDWQDAALEEAAIEPSHEEEAVKSGVVTADLRAKR